LDGVSLRVRRPTGRKQVQMLVAYGIRQNGSRRLLAFLRSQGEGQADWEALLQDLYRRGLEGRLLQLILTDGYPGLAAAIRTVYPRVRHQPCWVHKMRNIVEKVKKRDYEAVQADAQAIDRAESRKHAEAAFRGFRFRWSRAYPDVVRRLGGDLPELLSFFAFPRHLWRNAPPTLSNAVSSRCAAGLAPWFALWTWPAWTASSTPLSRDSTWNGKTASSSYLHKPLDVARLPMTLKSP
jgi:transposase-like protein